MEQNNLNLISTIATFLICFFVVMFGISRILNLANPSAPEKVRYAVARAENSNTSKAINQLLQSPEKITSEKMQALLPNFKDNSMHVQQGAAWVGENSDLIKRINLLDYKLQFIMSELDSILKEDTNKSLFLSLSFYFWGFIVWVFGIPLKIIIERVTNLHILPFLKIKYKNED